MRLVSAVLLAALFLNVRDVSAQGLPFDTEPFHQARPSLMVVPSSGSNSRGFDVDDASQIVSQSRDGLWSDRTLSTLRSYAADVFLLSERAPRTSRFLEAVEISRPGAAWLQLHLRNLPLQGAELVISAPSLNRTHVFTEADIANWNGYTLMFETDRLVVSIVNRDGRSLSVSDVVQDVIVGRSLTPARAEARASDASEDQAGDQEHVPCGTDQRQFSVVQFVGRMRTNFCTAFLIEGGLVLSAGHCLREHRDKQQVEFEVPHSNDMSIWKPAGDNHIFPIDLASVECSDCISGVNLDHGQDWAVFRLGRNMAGQRVQDVEGLGFPLLAPGALAQQTGKPVSLTGFGWDNDPPEAMFAQQTGGGRVESVTPSVTGVAIAHSADAETGNSGSPLLVLDNAIQRVAGIHTGGRCDPGAGHYNAGAGIDGPPLRAAIARLLARPQN